MKLNNTSTLVSLLCGGFVTLCATSAQAFSFTGFTFDTEFSPVGGPKEDIFLVSVDFGSGPVNSFNLVNNAEIINNALMGPVSTAGPGSPDRGDLATGGDPVDFPTLGSQIVSSLGNLNLNNIIDTEDNKGTSIFNLFFETPTDTLFFFERRMNSDLTVQAIDAVGNLLGESFEITRDLWESAGYSIDTEEIIGAQPVGSYGLKSTIGNIAGIQVSSFVGDNGPDYKVVAAQSESVPVPEPATLAGLGLVAGSLLVSRRRQANKAG